MAADSLISDGLRPTIERVRQKIGRGSPNTVSPMLESWFATLANRLGVNKKDDDPDGIPEAFQQALKNAWQIALTKSREASALETMTIQDNLKQATLALIERQTEIDQMERVRTVKQQALEESVNLAKSITDDALIRLSEAQRLATKREKEIHDLQSRLADVETARDSDRFRQEQMAAEHLQERRKFEERAQSTQQRLMEDIDRTRQAVKKISIEKEIAKKQLAAEKILLEEKMLIHEGEQSKLKALYASQSGDFHTLQEKFAASNLWSHEMRALLKAQLDESKGAVERLTQAFLEREAQWVSGPRSLMPKFKRTRRIGK